MPPARLVRALVAVAVAVSLASPTALSQETIGRTRVVVQTVTGETDESLRRLVVRDDVFQNEKIETEIESASIIRFADQTRLKLGPNARLVLDEAVFDPTPGRGAFVLTAFQGVFRFLSGNLDSASYEIKTPTASIGVRGTRFAGVVAPDGTTVIILQSPDEVIVRHLATGEQVTLDRHSDSTTAFRDGSLTEPGPAPGWARAMLQELDDLLRIDPEHIERNTDDPPQATSVQNVVEPEKQFPTEQEQPKEKEQKKSKDPEDDDDRDDDDRDRDDDDRDRDDDDRDRDRDDKDRDRDDKDRDRDDKDRDRDDKDRDRDDRDRDRGDKGKDRGDRGKDRGDKGKDRGDKGKDRGGKGKDRGGKGKDRGDKGKDRGGKKGKK